MPKVYIKRKINEDVTITDPTLAQQYLAVKKQITDKMTKKDQLMRSVNQIDSEINILNKNLLAIETKAASSQIVKKENPAQNQGQEKPATQEQGQQQTEQQ
jgi:hypothetical protein